VKPPGIFTGNSRGVISTAEAPARKGSALTVADEMASKPNAVKSIFRGFMGEMDQTSVSLRREPLLRKSINRATMKRYTISPRVKWCFIITSEQFVERLMKTSRRPHPC